MTDERSLKVLDVAEAFAHGKATKEELEKAREDAWAAVCAADCDADFDAALAATSAAARAAWIARAADVATEREAQAEILIELIKEYE